MRSYGAASRPARKRLPAKRSFRASRVPPRNRMAQRKRAIYLALRFGMLAAAAGAVAAGAPHWAASLRVDDAVALLVCLALFSVLLRINVPALSQVHARRRQPLEPGRLTLETPVMLAVLAFYGPIGAAAINLLGYPLAIP